MVRRALSLLKKMFYECDAVVTPSRVNYGPSMVTNSDRFEIVHGDAHCAIGTVANVVLAIWREETWPLTVRILGAEIKRLQARQKTSGVGVIQILEDGIKPLGGDARAEFSKILQAGQDYILCSSVVFEGDGFRAAAIRGIVTGLALFSRTPFPHTVFSNVEAAVGWHMAHQGRDIPGLTPDLLLECVEQLRHAPRDDARETA